MRRVIAGVSGWKLAAAAVLLPVILIASCGGEQEKPDVVRPVKVLNPGGPQAGQALDPAGYKVYHSEHLYPVLVWVPPY